MIRFFQNGVYTRVDIKSMKRSACAIQKDHARAEDESCDPGNRSACDGAAHQRDGADQRKDHGNAVGDGTSRFADRKIV